MKLIYKFFILSILLVVSCVEEEQNDNVGIGESINEFTLKSPENFTTVTLNPSTPTKVLTVEWNAAKTGLDGTPTYSFLLDVKGGDFSTPLLEVASDEDGIATTASISYSEIATAITGTDNDEFAWTVRATTVHPNGINEKLARTPFELIVEESAVGISDFVYTSPDNNQKLFLDKIRTPNDEVVISWGAATATAGTITYTFVAALTEDSFDAPVLELPSDNSGLATTLTFTHAELVEALSNIEYEDGLFWKIVASTTVGEEIVFSHSPETRFVWFEIFDVPTLYIVGSLTGGWNNTCGVTIEMTNKGGGVFEKLVNIPASSQFKFVLECGSWDVNWGGPGGDAANSTDYELVSNSSNNISVVAAGSYFVRADFAAGTFKITPFTPPTSLYLVGGATSAGWNPGASIPFVNLGSNKFEIYAYLAADGFKFLQVQDWAGDWGVKDGTAVTTNGVVTAEVVQDDEVNASASIAGFYRVTVDYNALTYTLEPMNWGIIGSATANGGPDSDMTFVAGAGSYKWTITTDLVAGEIKFRANDDWGVNFGDDGANGVLEYSAGSNIAIGAPGNYTIELNLHPVNGYTYTVTLNP
jgi:hypothetical protein